MPRSWNAGLEDPAPLLADLETQSKVISNGVSGRIGHYFVFKIPSFGLYLGPKPMEGEEPYLTPHQTSGQIQDHYIS